MSDRPRVPYWFLMLNLGLGVFGVVVLAVQLLHLLAPALPQREMTMLQLVHKCVLEDHVEPHDGAQLLQNAIAGMVESLDDRHSVFVPPAHVTAFEEETTGEYAGIGISMVPGRAPVTVHFLFEGGPAERAGLRVADEIVAIEGERIDALTAAEAVQRALQRLRGPAGTDVQLTVRRAGDEGSGGRSAAGTDAAPASGPAAGVGSDVETTEVDLVVTRGAVQQPSMRWTRVLDAEAGLGYTHMSGFHVDTPRELDAEIAWLQRELGGRLRGLLLDLRHNPGGFLDQAAVPIANRFLREGTIVSLKKRHGKEDKRYAADPKACRWPDLPLVLLVDGDSASASEVVAGCLQDHGRARVVGERTFGKGVVQSIFTWKELDFRLKLTTSHYYTPKGRNIEGNKQLRRPEDGEAQGGIAPDVAVALPDEQKATVSRALRANAFEPPRRYRTAARELYERLGMAPVEPPGPDGDAQLAAGLGELRRMVGGGVGSTLPAEPKASPAARDERVPVPR